MCGIVGITQRAEQVARAMASSLAHRGPDAEGVWLCDDAPLALGHRRLAILDLHARGDQPMHYRRGERSWTITFNGEIYNYRELERELAALGHSFRTTTDTEMILAAYAEWGPACVQRFNGMWAFAIWDASARKLFLSRDRFGKKPLYYTREACDFAFASEIKALLRIPGFPRQANPQVAADYLLRGLVAHSTSTFFAHVHALPAGHNAFYDVDAKTLDVEPYYTFAAQRESATVSELGQALRRAVELRTIADVPISISLSGGVDSSSIAALLAHSTSVPIAAFTTTAQHRGAQGDESALVRKFIARYPRFELHEQSLDEARFLADYDKLIYHAEEPLWGDAQYVRWEIARSVRAHGLKVMMTGEGADELLAGYWPASAFHLRGLLRQHAWGRLLRELRGALAQPDRALLAGGLAATLLHAEALAYRPAERAARRLGFTRQSSEWLLAPLAHGGLKDCLLQMITRYPLPQLLMCNDKMSMAHSVESRAPFMDVHFAETALALPEDSLIDHGIRKHPLREAMRELVPHEILFRRKKDSFGSPMARFLASPAVRATFDAHFSDARMAPVLDPARVRSAQRKHGIQPLLARLFWLECWSRVFDVRWSAA